MSQILAVTPSHENVLASNEVATRQSSASSNPTVLADVYNNECNIAIWQRPLDPEFATQLESYVQNGGKLTAARQLNVDNAVSYIKTLADDQPFAPQLHAYIAELVDMFAYLFEANTVGFRLSTLDRAMCPRFHVDRVPCRLVTTFLGPGSQWIEHAAVDRSKLGHRSNSSNDVEWGLIRSIHDINALQTGDVALLKGELWQGNENAGIVHRSPPVPANQPRIVMTLDLVD